MKLPLWQIDAFTQRRFGGNPAAVVPLREWLPETTMRAIAAENNLAETAFFVAQGDDYAIRWFTPTAEVPLCGHATLASAWVVLNRLEPERQAITFHSQSGPLHVVRDGDRLAMDFPAIAVEFSAPNKALVTALGTPPLGLFKGFQWIAEYPSERHVRELRPDFRALGALDIHAVIATAPGDDCDFVSRFFAPSIGLDEDPVTGSAHSRLVPFWAQKLGKTKFFARQISPRGGELWCELKGERVVMAGHATLYLEGMIEV